MPKLNWNRDDFRNPQDSSGTVADTISREGSLQQGYKHGSLTEGLLTYYSFEAGSGTTLSERTGIGIDGEVRGAEWTEEAFTDDYALSFNGSGDDVLITSPGLLSDTGTLNLKFKLRSRTDDYSYFFAHPDANNGNRIYILTEDNADSNVLSVGIGDSFPITTGFTPELDTWYAVTLEWNNGNYSIFLDGEKLQEGTYTGTVNASTDWFLGSQNGSRQYQDMVLDDVRIHERNLTLPEIQALHNLKNASEISPGDVL